MSIYEGFGPNLISMIHTTTILKELPTFTYDKQTPIRVHQISL